MKDSSTLASLFWKAAAVYVLGMVLYTIFSFSLTDPNLVLLSWNPYWRFQQQMWRTFFSNAPLLTYTYIGLISVIGVSWLTMMRCVNQLEMKKAVKVVSILALVSVSILFFSYNALSHDVFNYIFNAKMVMVYQADPHVKVALDFSQDDWTRFMHNTHTPAPYGRGWTWLSLIPFTLGMKKFLITWLLFRLSSILSFGLLVLVVRWGVQRVTGKPLSAMLSVFLFLNPLLLIEIMSNQHNDLWMMVPALFSILIVFSKQPFFKKFKNSDLKMSLIWILVSLALLLFSISIKLVTILLLPLWIFFVIKNVSWFQKLIKKLSLEKMTDLVSSYWSDVSLLVLFVPLLTSRAQQFHPWYLSWLLVWVPFLHWKWLRRAMIVLTFSSLLRYVPWLWNGGFSELIIVQQKMITFLPLMIWLLFSLFLHRKHFLPAS